MNNQSPSAEELIKYTRDKHGFIPSKRSLIMTDCLESQAATIEELKKYISDKRCEYPELLNEIQHLQEQLTVSKTLIDQVKKSMEGQIYPFHVKGEDCDSDIFGWCGMCSTNESLRKAIAEIETFEEGK